MNYIIRDKDFWLIVVLPVTVIMIVVAVAFYFRKPDPSDTCLAKNGIPLYTKELLAAKITTYDYTGCTSTNNFNRSY